MTAGRDPTEERQGPRPGTTFAGSGRHAMLVGAGILLSRIAGLIRQRVFAHFFGASAAADAFAAAFRIPNVLQNLFGEGVLSASFIPVYAGLLARGDKQAADRVARGVFALLGLLMAVLVLLGVLFAPVLVTLIAPGFAGSVRELTIRLVRILFPSTGLLVLSAWCLGVLNSHRRFFLSYVAPVVWNAAMITSMIAFGGERAEELAVILAWAAVAGSLLQIAVQAPVVLRLLRARAGAVPAPGSSGPSVKDRLSGGVRTVARNFVPVFIGRGVVQISAYVDELLATLLPTGSVASLVYAQLLYMLPVSLFGMSVSAAELPAMSGAVGIGERIAEELRARLATGLRRIAFFVVPSAVALLTLGDLIAGALYQTGRFTQGHSVWIWGILAAYAVGLVATTMGRLYSSTFYALGDTRTPLRFAIVRVALGIGLGFVFALHAPRALGLDPRWGVAGIALASALAGWLEFGLLRRALSVRIGASGFAARTFALILGASLAGAAAAWAVRLASGSLPHAIAPGAPGTPAPALHPILAAGMALAPFGAIYLALTAWAGIPEVGRVRRRLLRR